MPIHSAAGFHLISSNRLEVLAERLAARVAESADRASLRPQTLLIPQPTLRRWLQMELAQRLGIAANLEFLTPSEWVWRMLRAAAPGLPADSQWDQETLRWRLFALLAAGDLPVAVVEHLRRASGEGALARWRLAESLASAFDKYQAYRRPWLEAWETGAAPGDWQAELWRRLQGDEARSRSRLIGDWLQRYHDGTEIPPGLPPRLSAFGTINVSPDVLRMLAAAGRHCALDFYLPSPCAEYWGDVESLRGVLRRDGVDALPAALADSQYDNPLLKAWGATGRDFVAQLFSYELVQPRSEQELFLAPPRDRLLHAIQADVLERAAPRPIDVLPANDLSIQIHICHSRLREVEVLHDRLRGLLDDDPGLQPNQIAVLAPNIGDYLPLVRAVFGGIPLDDARFIPYSLSDRPQLQSHPLVGLFLSLLELPQARRSVSELRDLLAVPSVLAALELQESDLLRLDQWFAGAGIRWGEDEAMRERLGFGRWREHSFGFGVDRLLMGYASGESEETIAGIAPFAELEGADSERLDRLIGVLERLHALSEWLRATHPAHEWQETLARHFLALLPQVPLDETEQQARRTVLEALDAFAHQAAEAGELPVGVVAAALRESLQAPSPHQPFLAGGVTFAGMVPLRTVPFRAICLLGMDADAFPRREPGGDINRLVDEIQGGKRRLGDRSVREDDRFLFLQLLTAASDVFYLSYGGRDARDGKVREPSALVAELLDVAQRYLPAATDGSDQARRLADARQRLVIEHPLQPFSAQAFGVGDARRFSYRDEWRQPPRSETLAQAAPFFARTLPALEPVKSVTLDTLQYFFRNPAQGFLRDRLGLQLPRGEAGDGQDREPLGDNALVRHQLVSLLLDGDRDDAVLRARGLLPPGRDGASMAQAARMIATPVRDAAKAWLGEGEAQALESRLSLQEIEIPLRLSGIHGGRRALMLAGGLKGKYWLRALIEHLAFAAVQGEVAQTAVFFTEKSRDGATEACNRALPTLSAPEARAWLGDLLALWREGQTRPLPFAPDAAWRYVETLEEKDDPDAAWNAAVAAFDDHQGYGDANDAWMRLAFRPHGLLSAAPAAEFRGLAERVFRGPREGSA